MSFDDASCSDCRLELIEKVWTQLLLNWINKCVNPVNQVNQLDVFSLSEIVNKYKNEICLDDIDHALLARDDIEQFIKCKYPMLQIRYLPEVQEYAKKIYTMHSILLFHCCSQSDVVDHDICTKMDKGEQEFILRFCENLSEMEKTINNVDLSIKEAFEHYGKKPKYYTPHQNGDVKKDNDVSTGSESNTIERKVALKIRTRQPSLKFKASVTVLPSYMVETSSGSKSDLTNEVIKDGIPKDVDKLDAESKDGGGSKKELECKKKQDVKNVNDTVTNILGDGDVKQVEAFEIKKCESGCACVRCSITGPCCGDPGPSMDACKCDGKNVKRWQFRRYFTERCDFKNNKRFYLGVLGIFVVFIIIVAAVSSAFRKDKPKQTKRLIEAEELRFMYIPNVWRCDKGLCQKVHKALSTDTYFTSFSRCSLICSGPQLWPHPIGYTHFSKKLIAITTNRLEYKFQSIPSESVHRYLAEAFKLFIGDLARLENSDDNDHNITDLIIKKMNIVIDVETDGDPRMTQSTDESYTVKVETFIDEVLIKVSSASFAGVRHGLESLSQMILLDQASGYLITLTHSLVKDAPSYRYRGLMIDTGRNYIPVADLLRTIDTMATVKLNTFHWRISDATSFPLYLPELPQLFEFGAYDRSKIYTKQDITTIVRRAGIRGIRILIEVSVPGPVGRAWSWSKDTSCPMKNLNSTCDNILCLRLKMKKQIFDVLEKLYALIIDLTKVNDVFHLSNGMFSLARCVGLIDDKEEFLDHALVRLKLANKGVMPSLPIVWYTTHLKNIDSMVWDKQGVQLHDWVQDPGERPLGNFKVIHSSRWDLSCIIQKGRCTKYRTWQEMYAWKSWKNLEVYAIEGGEATLWTDLVDSGNLDYHIWPRLCAVAERLWSDVATNASAHANTYARLDAHRWRMLIRGVKVQPVWPVYCSVNPIACANKLKV